LSSSAFSELQIIQVNAAGKEKEGFIKKLIQSEKSKAFITVIATISCLALSPIARAVVPPPDGGYANFTTAEGQNALFSLTTGAANTAVGCFSLWGNATGEFNTATGAGALLFNNGDPTAGEASENTAFGAAALLFNTTGAANTAVGAAALLNNTTGVYNTATGNGALVSNTTGNVNTATGVEALHDNTDGEDNTANGYRALLANTTGDNNTACGVLALSANTSGTFNTALGRGSRQWRQYGQQRDCYRHQCREREQQLLHRQYIQRDIFRGNRCFR